jgi:hypothetical protein
MSIKKPKIIVAGLCCLLIGGILSWSLPALASSGARPGSAEDPLVTKSWADDYINNEFNKVSVKIDEIRMLLKNASAKHIILYIGNNVAAINGTNHQLDIAPEVLPPGHTVVPLRFISEGLGVKVDWNGQNKEITCTDGGKTIKLTIGSKTAMVAGKSYLMPVAPYIVKDRTLVPLRFIAEAFDCEVSWDGTLKKIDIIK